jgi:diphosphomevalonate decarboxylase
MKVGNTNLQEQQLKMKQFVAQVLEQRSHKSAEIKQQGQGFAPSNIALCKYWGKRDAGLNLPETNSLSISLGPYGAKTRIQLQVEPSDTDTAVLNGQKLKANDPFLLRLSQFLDLFREQAVAQELAMVSDLGNTHYHIETEVNLPIAAGLASSACGFAALVLALNDLYTWNLKPKQLSLLARLGSGSACRSLWSGFVEWERGTEESGLDSFGVRLDTEWPGLRLGLLILNAGPKSLSSRVAMARTKATSPYYSGWKTKVQEDLLQLKTAVVTQDFTLLGETAEANALALHALMLSSSPPVLYSKAETVSAWDKIWQLRAAGLPLYFTQDAGPNLKLLFQAEHSEWVCQSFPDLQIIDPFNPFNPFFEG